VNDDFLVLRKSRRINDDETFFSVAVPCAWNRLRTELECQRCVSTFKHKLETLYIVIIPTVQELGPSIYGILDKEKPN